MKKAITILLSILISMVILSACSSKQTTQPTINQEQPTNIIMLSNKQPQQYITLKLHSITFTDTTRSQITDISYHKDNHRLDIENPQYIDIAPRINSPENTNKPLQLYYFPELNKYLLDI